MNLRQHHIVLRVSFVVAVSSALLVLGVIVTPIVSAFDYRSLQASQSSAQVQIRINATVNAVMNRGNVTLVSGTGVSDSGETPAISNEVQLHLTHFGQGCFRLI